MLKIYNTLTRRKEIFRPRHGKQVRMFVCGPTVYDFAHIGHGRTYLVFDLVVKYFRAKGFQVRYILNITDIDDKIILRAKQRGKSWQHIAREFERAYLADMAHLGITSMERFARATDFIPAIVRQIQRLLRRKAAYRIEGDGIYFDLKKFPRYGRLAKRTSRSAEDAISRIDESVGKRNRGDFCLWKFSKPGEPTWNTPLGPGRPGWHIEDTAITHALLGPQYDIHGGAIDLIFPHHEAEIAQMETAYGKRPMAKYWMHSGFLNVGGEKMSKSLRNFITIRELLDTWPPEVFRFFVFSTHYRSLIDYDADLLAQAAASLERLKEFLQRIQEAPVTTSKKPGNNAAVTRARKAFVAGLDDDFDTPKALATMFTLVRTMNPLVEKGAISQKDSRAIRAFFTEANNLLGIFTKGDLQGVSDAIPEAIRALVAQREELRRRKRFADADAIRQKALESGWLIEDTPQGPRLKRT